MNSKEVLNFSLADVSGWLQMTATVARQKIQLSDGLKSDITPSHRDRRLRGAVAYHASTNAPDQTTKLSGSSSQPS